MSTVTEPVSPSIPADDQAAALRRLVSRLAASPSPRRDRVGLMTRTGCAPVVAIASGKGGVGKSTVAVNVAVGLGRRRRTVLVDGDLGTANADVMCGLAPTRRLDAELFRASGPDLDSLTIQTPWGFDLVPGAAGVAHAPQLDNLQRAAFIGSLRRLASPGDAVLLDLGAGISAPVVESVAASDLAVIVTTTEPTAIADAYALIKCVVRHRDEPRPLRMGVVINMADTRQAGRAAHDRIDRVCKRFLGGSMPLLGIIRRDRRAPLAIHQRTPLLAGPHRGPARRDLRELCEMLVALTPKSGRFWTGEDRS